MVMLSDVGFFFQAEDGIRYLVRSRGLGDVYKRQVLNRIGRGEIELEPVRATVEAAKCSGCRICNNLCPFGAIIFHEDLMVSEVKHALCQGCGTCVAACPAGAISGSGFSLSLIHISEPTRPY